MGSMNCFDFHTVTAFLSESLDFVMVCAVALMALFISSVTPIQKLLSLFSFMGIFIGEAARILPMSSPFARVVSTVYVFIKMANYKPSVEPGEFTFASIYLVIYALS